VVFDSTSAVEADRLRLSVDGVRPAFVTPNEGGQAIPMNVPLAVFPPSGGHYQQLALGGYTNYAAGTGGFRGRIYYAAIYRDALTDAEIAGAPGRLLPRP
jgi:hypothetical protein